MNRPTLLAISLVITQPSGPSTIADSAGLIAQPPAGAEQVVEEYQGWSCGSPFYTLAEGRMAADAIVHVRLDYQVTYDHAVVATGDSEVMTAHEATVLDVFKPHPRAMAAGSSMSILQPGGVIRRHDGLHRHLWNQFETMPAATEWVLFLRWNRHWEGFQVLNYEEGAFQILDAKVAPAGRGTFAEKWGGQTSSAFLRALAEGR
jgi:hypothetical protein